jgi:hypothetical protein
LKIFENVRYDLERLIDFRLKFSSLSANSCENGKNEKFTINIDYAFNKLALESFLILAEDKSLKKIKLNKSKYTLYLSIDETEMARIWLGAKLWVDHHKK